MKVKKKFIPIIHSIIYYYQKAKKSSFAGQKFIEGPEALADLH